MAQRSSKSLSPEQNAAVRAVVREIVDAQFGGNIRAASYAMKITYSLLNNLYNGRAGAGSQTITRLADFTGRSTDEILGRRHPSASGADEGTGAGRILGWTEAIRRCAAANTWTQPWMFERAARVSGVDAPSPMTPEWVLEAVKFVLAASSLREKAEATRRQTEAEIQKHVRDSARRVARAKGSRTGTLPLEGAITVAARETGEPAKRSRGKRAKR